jgi:hypothetical protein
MPYCGCKKSSIVRSALDGAGDVAAEHVSRLLDGFVEYERSRARAGELSYDATLTSTMYIARAKNTILEALADATQLCRTSISIGSPIRLLW